VKFATEHDDTFGDALRLLLQRAVAWNAREAGSAVDKRLMSQRCCQLDGLTVTTTHNRPTFGRRLVARVKTRECTFTVGEMADWCVSVYLDVSSSRISLNVTGSVAFTSFLVRAGATAKMSNTTNLLPRASKSNKGNRAP
jgi:hypothetical protein